jgi:hypothetical protein
MNHYIVSEEVLRQVLETLEVWSDASVSKRGQASIQTLRSVLTKGPVEPVAWKDMNYGNLHHQSFDILNDIPLYAIPEEQS